VSRADEQRELLRHWDIGQVARITPMGWTGDAWRVEMADGECFVLKRNPNWAEPDAAARVLQELAVRGLPVPAPIPARDGAVVVTDGDASVCVSRHLPGEEVSDHYGEGAEARAAAFGEGIARLHRALAACEVVGPSRTFGLAAELRGPIQKLLRSEAAEGLWPAVESLYGELLTELEAVEPQLPAQIIHRDAHPGNLLFDGERVCGYLDFDLVVRCVRVYDLAYCSTAMLSGGFGDPGRRRQWLVLVGELARGYERVVPLMAVERSALCPVQVFVQLDVAAFHTNRGRPGAARESCDAAVWIRDQRRAIEESLS
jgi:Ser/Thr protein kinase RdoA (MazF antagonist)